MTASRAIAGNHVAVPPPTPQARPSDVSQGPKELRSFTPTSAPQASVHSFVPKAPEVTPSKAVPASLLSDDISPTQIREIPENVLMGVLAD